MPGSTVFAQEGLVRRAFLALSALALAGILQVLWVGSADAATTFTVNTTGDAADRNVADSKCDVSGKAGLQCTLRAAIREADNTPNSGGPDRIDFDIGGTALVKTISPAFRLPAINEPAVVDGYSQPGATPNGKVSGTNATLKIQLSGAKAGSKFDGLQITAPNSTIKGLVINRFDRYGILVQGSAARNNRVEGNYVGTDASGTKDLGNDWYGVLVQDAPKNSIGGVQPAKRNIISGNDYAGVELAGSGTNTSTVAGNYIGTDATGTRDLGNTYGVHLSQSTNNTIGGTVAGARNVISGNRLGISFFSGASGNKVEGSYVGTDASGTQNLGNFVSGIYLQQSTNNTIGGTVAGSRNVISGNGGSGIMIVAGASGNKVQGNYVGTDASGAKDLSNSFAGVEIDTAGKNTVGGTVAGSRNVISGNGGPGVRIASGTGNSVLSNSIYSNEDPSNLQSELGIDLGPIGVAPNDQDDADTGANNLQNFPVITSAIRDSATGDTVVTGTLNSNPNQTYTIKCYLTEAGSGDADHGEGKTLIGTTTTATDAVGDSPTFNCTSGIPEQGESVTMTATNTSGTATNTRIGDTSEFSLNAQVTGGP